MKILPLDEKHDFLSITTKMYRVAHKYLTFLKSWFKVDDLFTDFIFVAFDIISYAILVNK